MDKIEELLTRGVANIIPNKEELKKILSSGKKLNVYLGIDPTATKIHLGHAVVLRKLSEFAKLEHNVTFLIGDFTALIGDTSDKDTERPVLTSEQIQENFKTYKKQAEKILDFSKIKIRQNSEWLKKLTFEEIIKLCQHFSFGDFTGRELIKNRLVSEQRIGLHEALYPVMQGYDSYFLDTDIQLGGTDQLNNMQAGRTLQKAFRKKNSYVMTTHLLHGTDGDKMSKTKGNVIWLEDKSEDMYAKIMAIHDDFIIEYYELATSLPISKVLDIASSLKSISNPISIKKQLAFTITSELCGNESAKRAQSNFENFVQQKQEPQHIPVFDPSTIPSFRPLRPTNTGAISVEPIFPPAARASGATIVDALVSSNLAGTVSEAKRVIEQGGVRYDNKVITNSNEPFIPKENAILKVGKHSDKIRRIKIELKTAPK